MLNDSQKLYVKSTTKEIIDIRLPIYQQSKQQIQMQNQAEDTQNSVLYTIQRAQDNTHSQNRMRGMLSSSYSNRTSNNNASLNQTNSFNLQNQQLNNISSQQQRESTKNTKNISIINQNINSQSVIEYSCIPIKDATIELTLNDSQSSSKLLDQVLKANNNHQISKNRLASAESMKIMQNSRSQSFTQFKVKETNNDSKTQISQEILKQNSQDQTKLNNLQKENKIAQSGKMNSKIYGSQKTWTGQSNKKSKQSKSQMGNGVQNNSNSMIVLNSKGNDYSGTTPLSNKYYNQVMQEKLQKQLMNCAHNFHIINKRLASKIDIHQLNKLNSQDDFSNQILHQSQQEYQNVTEFNRPQDQSNTKPQQSKLKQIKSKTQAQNRRVQPADQFGSGWKITIKAMYHHIKAKKVKVVRLTQSDEIPNDEDLASNYGDQTQTNQKIIYSQNLQDGLTRNDVGIDPKSRTTLARVYQPPRELQMMLLIQIKIINFLKLESEMQNSSLRESPAHFHLMKSQFHKDSLNVKDQDSSIQKAQVQDKNIISPPDLDRLIIQQSLEALNQYTSVQMIDQLHEPMGNDTHHNIYKTEQSNSNLQQNFANLRKVRPQQYSNNLPLMNQQLQQNYSSEISVSMYAAQNAHKQPKVNININNIQMQIDNETHVQNPSLNQQNQNQGLQKYGRQNIRGNSKMQERMKKKSKMQQQQAQLLPTQYYQMNESQFYDNQSGVRIRKQSSSMAAKKLIMSKYSQAAQIEQQQELASQYQKEQQIEKNQRKLNKFQSVFPIQHLASSQIQSVNSGQPIMNSDLTQLKQNLNHSSQYDMINDGILYGSNTLIPGNANESTYLNENPYKENSKIIKMHYAEVLLENKQTGQNVNQNLAITSTQNQSMTNSLISPQILENRSGVDTLRQGSVPLNQIYSSNSELQQPQKNSDQQQVKQYQNNPVLGKLIIKSNAQIKKRAASQLQQRNESGYVVTNTKQTNHRNQTSSLSGQTKFIDEKFQKEHKTMIENLKAQLFHDDVEIIDLMRICGGYKYDQQKMNRLMLNRVQQKHTYNRQGKTVKQNDSQTNITQDSILGGLNPDELQQKIDEISKEIIYSKIELNKQLSLNDQQQFPDIPGKLPLSEIMSGGMSQRDQTNEFERDSKTGDLNAKSTIQGSRPMSMKNDPFADYRGQYSIEKQNYMKSFLFSQDQKNSQKSPTTLKISNNQIDISLIDKAHQEANSSHLNNYSRIINQRKQYQESPNNQSQKPQQNSYSINVKSQLSSQLNQSHKQDQHSYESINVNSLKNNKHFNQHIKNQTPNFHSYNENPRDSNNISQYNGDYDLQQNSEHKTSTYFNMIVSKQSVNQNQYQKRGKSSSLVSRKRGYNNNDYDRMYKGKDLLMVHGSQNKLLNKSIEKQMKNSNQGNHNNFNGSNYESLWNQKGNFDINTVLI
eukprot:403336399